MAPDEIKSTQLIADPELTLRLDLGRLRLVCVDGPDAGRACPLGHKPVCVGTDPAADLVLCDSTVSRRHLLVRQDPEGAWLQDQGSTNGTFFEGSRVRELVVPPGSAVRVGKTTLKIVPQEDRLRPAPAAEGEFQGVIGTSRRMREIFATLKDVAPSDLTLLVEGETGTGKEALAEAVHRASPRANQPFVVFDCTAVPRELVESELFGHKKGAFTGAVADRGGCFEQAHQGTIFLDEIGDLIPELQPKLLRVLERRQIKPVGGDRTRDVNVRVIAATHKDLRAEVAAGRFREDLYYRLAVLTIRVPPLRERTEDLGPLMAHFLRRAAGPGIDTTLPPAALIPFQPYPWPGNVRELRNVVERAYALRGRERFDRGTFLDEIVRGLGENCARAGSRQERPGEPLPFKEAKSQVVDAFERAYLQDLVARHHGNLSRAAREAQLDRHHLKDLLTKHGISAK